MVVGARRISLLMLLCDHGVVAVTVAAAVMSFIEYLMIFLVTITYEIK